MATLAEVEAPFTVSGAVWDDAFEGSLEDVFCPVYFAVGSFGFGDSSLAIVHGYARAYLEAK